jgi:hypothetical protein
MRGRCPRAPGIYRFGARMLRCLLQRGEFIRPRHSGSCVGALDASLRCHTLRAGVFSILSCPRFHYKNIAPGKTARYNYSCSGWLPLAGFEVITYGRF